MTVADFIVEVAESFRTGRRRFILASVTTMFGMFLLVLLVGAGSSVTRGLNSMYFTVNQKYFTINAGTTSLPYKGHDKGMPILLDESDIRNLADRYPDKIDRITPVVQRASSVTINGRTTRIRSYGVKAECLHSKFFHSDIYRGRDFNSRDIATRSKVCLISDVMAERYFASSDIESAISRNIEIDGVYFQIIGIFKGWRSDVDTNFIILPATTASILWKMEDKYTTVELDINVNAPDLQTKEEEAAFRDTVRKLIAHEHSFDYHDRNALMISDGFVQYRQAHSLLDAMKMAILLFCIFILISGVFGVSNILFISVRERTYEIVLRRLMGASDANIFALVVCESVVIMSVSSLFGIFLAEGALHLLDSAVSSMRDGDRGIWGSFLVDFSILTGVILATIVSGIMAGLAPAKRAVKLKITEVH